MKNWMLVAIAVLTTAGVMYLGGLAWGGDDSTQATSSNTSTQHPQTPAVDTAAVKEYADDIFNKLDQLYDKFEQGEAHAKQIYEEGLAPYNTAIGYMAEVRKTVDEVTALSAPQGAQAIREVTLNRLRTLQNGLDEIASKEDSDVSLSDPNIFYSAYLDVLIEIPKLKQEVVELVP